MKSLSTILHSPGQLAAAAFGLALASIVAAWGFELIGGYQPCALCLTQRVPYYVALPLIGLGWWLQARPGRKTVAAAALGIAAVTFLVGVGYGVYHSGVEWGFWPGPTACSATPADGAGTVGDLLSQLETVRVVACDEVQWRFLGLTFANYNVLISLSVALLSALAAIRLYGSSSVSQ